jgi:hypothetical protein
MDADIPSGSKKKDKPRERLDEFLRDRYPGGVPPGAEPDREAPPKAPAPTKRAKTKKTTRRK